MTQPQGICVCAFVSSVVFMSLIRTKLRCYTQMLLPCVVLYFYKIMKYVATARMLIMERETRKHLKIVFYYVQNAINWWFYWVTFCQQHRSCHKILIFYKQLGSGLSPQSCFYSQGFWCSKLLDGCLIHWPRKLCLRGLQ